MSSPLLRSITGWQPRKYSEEFSDPLAYHKFCVFAFVSALLVPDAAKLFRRALQQERFGKNNDRRSRRLLQRDRQQKKQLYRRADRLVSALLASLRLEKHEGGLIFPPPHWKGEARPFGARRVRVHTRFPSAGYLTYLVKELGYEGNAAAAALVRAHTPWTRPRPDRRRATTNTYGDEAEIASPKHPYYPMSPSRRTKVGGGITKEMVRAGLRKMRTDGNTKAALIEIVYRRRSTLRVSDEFNVPAEVLYVYASRLRGHIRANEQADMSA